MTARLVVEYDGSRFAGWARQPGVRTVQEEVERALGVVLRAEAGFVPVAVAGRTDSGVHALGQVCSYDGEVVPVRALNGLLPADVAVLSCAAVDDGFDARRDATSRAYCYRVLARRAPSPLLAGRVLWWPHAVDVGLLDECAGALVGVHDFTAFTPTETDHVRFEREVLGAEWRRAGGGVPEAGGVPGMGGVPEAGGVPKRGGVPGTGGVPEAGGVPEMGGVPGILEFWIEADAFMRHMNRVLVGTMLEVAGGRRTLAKFLDLLEGRPRSEAGPTAPACGLYLVGVGYGGERVLQGATD